jgi:LysM repeat protein
MDLFFSKGAELRFRFPVTPKSVSVTTPGRDRTEKLIDTAEISVLGKPGLREIAFEALLPNQRYPFAGYLDDVFRPAAYFIKLIERLKDDREPFLLILGDNRIQSRNGLSMTVNLESYAISEDASHGGDTVVSLRLKEWRNAALTVIHPDSPTPPPPPREPPVAVQPQTYTVVRGDTLWAIARRFLGDGSKWPEIHVLNRATITNPNLIHPGQVVILP